MEDDYEFEDTLPLEDTFVPDDPELRYHTSQFAELNRRALQPRRSPVAWMGAPLRPAFGRSREGHRRPRR
ncbi:MAG: hypothetical protein AB7S38_08540 [Vulcanimicrobiota bacterium]